MTNQHNRSEQQHAGEPDDSLSPATSANTSTGSEHNPVYVERYSLTTAICLIMGVCIGSGIFFKSDNILVATGGNVLLGALMFLLSATTIVFGGLTLARYASRTNGHGGAIAYAKEFLGPKWLTFIGWHYTFLYAPVVTAIVCWVVGVYACLSFGLPNDFLLQVGIGSVFMVLCAAWNMCWPVLSGYFGNFTTVAKVLPLVAVGVLGLLFANPAQQFAVDIEAVPTAGFGWLAAAAPIAFAFDGWSSSVSIAPELKNARRNLPIALVVAPLAVLVLYLGYFLGLSCYLGPETVMASGDASLSLMFARLFGEKAAALPNVIALIAVMGTANGMTMAQMRMPYALAFYNEVPCAKALLRVNNTLRFPVASGLVATGISLFWMLVHVAVTEFGLLPNGDISEVSVGIALIVLNVFYIHALREQPAEGVSRLRSAIAPLIAMVSSLLIGVSSVSDPTRWPFVLGYFAILTGAVIWNARRKKKAAAFE